jgi:hypothetical protein
VPDNPVGGVRRIRGMWVRLLAAAAVVALLPAVTAARAADPVLTGDVGRDDSLAISLTDASGVPVTHLDPGTYSLVVHDRSDFHNFHLTGPGVDEATGVTVVEDRTVTVTLTDGMYVFVCDAHPTQMRRTFTVGAVTAPPAPKRLTASIGPAGAVSLRPVGGLSAGKVVIAVSDRTSKDGFRLAGAGLSKSTGVAFRGTVTWTVTLRPGRYTFGSLRHPTLRRSFSVS